MKTRPLAATLFPYAVFLLLTAISWSRWIEPYVDSGRELMTPWRIAQGETLYRDVRFYHGPLGPYLAAAVELVAPRSLPARILFAAAIALLHLEGIRRLANRFLAAGRAAVVTALIIAAAFFLRPGGCHLFPFSLDTSIAVAAITWALLGSASGSRGDSWLASGCLLAALLSRPELGLAATAALLVEGRPSGGPARPRRFAALTLLPLGAAAFVYAALSWGVPGETLAREGWLAFLKPPPAFRNVYASYAGFDRPGLRLAELLLAAIVLAVAGAALFAGAALAARLRAGGLAEAAALLLLAAAAVVRYRPPARFAETLSLFPPLIRVVPPLVIAALLMRIASRFARRSGTGLFASIPDSVLLLASLFSLRMFLVAGYFGPYNAFLLPLPLLVAATGLYAAAERLARAAGPGLPRLVTGALCVLLLFRTGSLHDLFRHPAWSRVETSAGALFLPEPVAGTTRLALADLARRLPPGATLVGFPETGFFNYALGAGNPLPQEQFFPGHLGREAEEEAIGRLSARPPDALVYVNVLAVGHGSAAFGKDYLGELDRFARERFPAVAAYGPGAPPTSSPRIGDPDFFIEVRAP